MRRNEIVCADALDYMKTLPDESVNCVVTSPPYYALRDYGVSGQIGLEATPQAFVAKMVEVFHEVKRVLRNDGVCWINLGDSYSGSGKGKPQGSKSGKQLTNAGSLIPCVSDRYDVPGKNLLGMPWRVAFALQDDGWILRSDVIWSKPNPMPESVTDRPTKAHEYVFLLAKSPKYWYDADAIREDNAYGPERAGKLPGYTNGVKGHVSGTNFNPAGRNRRTVWTIPTEPTPEAHFATFPQKLIEPMILAGCPDKCCSACGAPHVRIVEARGGTIGKAWVSHLHELDMGMSDSHPGLDRSVSADGIRYHRIDLGFCPQCDHAKAPTVPGIVFDPFMGSGTTALVARRLGRDFVGCELSPEYVDMANRRLAATDPFLDREMPNGFVQKSLFSESEQSK